MKADISIIIVNYNTGDLLLGTLESIRRCLSCNYEVIVADNGSSDGSVEMCSGIWNDSRFTLIQTGENLGFAKANNIAAKRATGRILHFLNPDTALAEGMDSDYAEAMDHPDAVYINPLVNRDGSYENDRMPIPTVRDIFWWTVRRRKARFWYKGASVIISRENFDRIGHWSEDYFLYAEDLDLFYKIWMNGIPIKMLHTDIFHYGGGSSRNRWNTLERETVVQRSNRIFYRKFMPWYEYPAVKIYYLLHTAVKRPASLPVYIKAWINSGK